MHGRRSGHVRVIRPVTLIEGFKMKITKAQRQAQYLAEFSDAVVTANPAHAGKIEWPSALHFYFTGVSVADAAAKYLANRADDQGATNDH